MMQRSRLSVVGSLPTVGSSPAASLPAATSVRALRPTRSTVEWVAQAGLGAGALCTYAPDSPLATASGSRLAGRCGR